MPAAEIRRYVDSKIWSSYYKFCVDRNPWGKAVSSFHWVNRHLDSKVSFGEFISSNALDTIKGFDQYSQDSRILMDRVYRYDELADAMEHIAVRLDLGDIFELPRAKSGVRKIEGYRSMYFLEQREVVAKHFRREIEYFGFEY